MNKNEFLDILKQRFNDHMYRHEHITWDDVSTYLVKDLNKLNIIHLMEQSGGEPDLFVYQQKIMYIDFSKETPKGRVSLCYDKEARQSRKKFPPESSAEEMAEHMGISLLDERMYSLVQEVDTLDLKTSSWLLTPHDMRQLGGALFGDRRYNRIFIYHNGADSYYNSRGFRGYITLK